MQISLNHVREDVTPVYAVTYAPTGDGRLHNPVTVALETYDAADWSDYATVATSPTSQPLRYDVQVNTTPWLNIAGTYTSYFYEQVGSSPDQDSDLAFGNVYTSWDGDSLGDVSALDPMTQYPVIDDIVDAYHFTIFYYSNLKWKVKHDRINGLIGISYVDGETWSAT